MSRPKLGRPKRTDARDTKEGYQDNVDRIEVERFFSLDKRCNGAGLIMTRLEETTLSSIALSVFVTNLFAIPIRPFFCFILGKTESTLEASISSCLRMWNEPGFAIDGAELRDGLSIAPFT